MDGFDWADYDARLNEDKKHYMQVWQEDQQRIQELIDNVVQYRKEAKFWRETYERQSEMRSETIDNLIEECEVRYWQDMKARYQQRRQNRRRSRARLI